MFKCVKKVWHNIRESFKEPDIDELFEEDNSKTDVRQANDRAFAEVTYQATRLIERYGSIDKALKALDRYTKKSAKDHPNNQAKRYVLYSMQGALKNQKYGVNDGNK